MMCLERGIGFPRCDGWAARYCLRFLAAEGWTKAA
jgi:hypothetical protein